MLRLHKPSPDDITAFLARQFDSPFSYAPVGATCDGFLAGYTIDHHRVQLGHGQRAFDSAVAALRRWTMFEMPWLTLCWPDVPIEAGSVVAIVVQIVGVWSVSACRIVYVINEDADVRRYGFAYGTLADHLESGEERFSIEWRRTDNSVWFDLLACSRPNHPLVRVGKPLARWYQRRFARDSMRAMLRAVASCASTPGGNEKTE
jgi:uncharacterized protein (UPF0548 family)